jgi:hypothetical protein
MAFQSFKFPPCPSDQYIVQMLQSWIQRRFVKASVVVYPPSYDRANYPRQIFQGHITSQMQLPSPTRLSHLFPCLIAYARGKADEVSPFSILRFSRPEREAQKIKACRGVFLSAVSIFAVDNTSLFRVKF